MIKPLIAFIRQNPIFTFGSGFIILSFIMLILAMGSVFSPYIVIPILCLFFVAILLALGFFFRGLTRKETLGLICTAILTVSAVSLSHTEPTVFTGRDQGSISMAAIELANHHRLTFSIPLAADFFSIYGEGTALHFPGFFYTTDGSLTTAFPLGYTVFLAAFFQTFGLLGLSIGNSLLLLTSTLTLFCLLRKLTPAVTWLGMILFTSSIIPLFLVHLTLTENFALFLFLFLALQLTEFFRTASTVTYFGALLPALFFPFVRIEGFVFLGITVIMLCSTKDSRRFIREKFLERCILPIGFFAIFLTADFFANTPFYRMIGHVIKKEFSAGDSATEAVTSLFTLPSILSLYGLLPIIIAGIVGSFILFRSKKYVSLIPVILALPTLMYLFSPSITPDHPWMLRRFLFSVWPALFLTTVFTIDVLLKQEKLRKSILYAVFFLLILGQTPALFSFFTGSNTAPLLPQVESFSTQFQSTDRVLIDREVTGDGFTMISGPLASLFDVNAAYFFNPLDMKKLPSHEGQTTYLLIPEEKFSFYQDNLSDFTLTPKESRDFALRSREVLPASIAQFPRFITHERKNVLLEVTPR